MSAGLDLARALGQRFVVTETPGVQRLWSDGQVTFAPTGPARGRRPPSPKTLAIRHRALAACERAGVKLPTDPRARLPEGVGAVAAQLGVSRQTFSEQLRAALADRAGLHLPASQGPTDPFGTHHNRPPDHA